MAGLRRSSRLSTKEDQTKNKAEDNEVSLPPKKKSKTSNGSLDEGEGEQEQEEQEEQEEEEGEEELEEAQLERDAEFEPKQGDVEAEAEVEQKEESEVEAEAEAEKKEESKAETEEPEEPKAEEEEPEEPEEPKELEEGNPIPDVVLKNQDGKEISLKKASDEHKIVVIFGYPKASTPGCTRQACGFRDNYEELKEHAAVFGLSADSVNSQKKFQEKEHLPFDLLSDPDRELIGLLGAKKTPESGIIRSHWVFSNGVLKYKRVKISPEVSIEEGKKEVLDLVKQFEGEGEGEADKSEQKEDGEKQEDKGE